MSMQVRKNNYRDQEYHDFESDRIPMVGEFVALKPEQNYTYCYVQMVIHTPNNPEYDAEIITVEVDSSDATNKLRTTEVPFKLPDA